MPSCLHCFPSDLMSHNRMKVLNFADNWLLVFLVI